MLQRIWEPVPGDDSASAALQRDLGVTPIMARLLIDRGVHDAESARRFLSPSLADLHDPFGLADMAPAIDRIHRAMAQGERIAIHGDYDVDGVTSTVILRRALELLGADVVHFIPERMRDGYGLQAAGLDRLREQGVALVISVDCGIRGVEAAKHARAVGLDLIITDHHEPDGQLPDAVAVVNPKRHDCQYADRDLAGVGVALKVVQALCQRAGRLEWLPGFVKIAAIGTLADVVPLVGENRVIAKLGLAGLSAGPNRVGVRALIEVCGLAGRMLEGHHVGFALAPRINAAGRMSTPDLAARLLLASDEAMAPEARALAERLDRENQRRRDEEAAVVLAAQGIVDSDPQVGGQSVLVVSGEGWHRGVIGIVASKLVDAYQRPAIVVSVEGQVAHGSCRSLAPFDMLAALDSCRPVFTRHGGHRQAAGFTMPAGEIATLRERINAYADSSLEPLDFAPRLRIDGSIGFREISDTLLSELRALAPFGPGNTRPVFATRGVEVVDGPRRLKDRHLRITFKHEGRVIRGIAWRAVERETQLREHHQALDVAFTVEEDEWKGRRTLQLNVADIRPPTP